MVCFPRQSLLGVKWKKPKAVTLSSSMPTFGSRPSMKWIKRNNLWGGVGILWGWFHWENHWNIFEESSILGVVTLAYAKSHDQHFGHKRKVYTIHKMPPPLKPSEKSSLKQQAYKKKDQIRPNMRKKTMGQKSSIGGSQILWSWTTLHALLPAAGSAFTNGPAGHELCKGWNHG